jgi:leucyl-tRNA synthetase
VPVGLPAEDLEALARADEKIAELLEGATIRKAIAVPDKLVNFVLG